MAKKRTHVAPAPPPKPMKSLPPPKLQKHTPTRTNNPSRPKNPRIVH